jgi:PKHD-type hydroxylase
MRTGRRRPPFDLDLLCQAQGDSDPVVRLTGCYHNLMRMWADL